MSNESGKRLRYLEHDPLWRRVSRYSEGSRLDIGCGPWPIPGAEPYDMEQGDAERLMPPPAQSHYKLVWSSHCLEHLDDPIAAITNWWKYVEPEGYLWLLVPDFLLHEHGVWPSRNLKHKWGICWESSWGQAGYSLDLSILLGERIEPNGMWMRMQRCDNGYDYTQLRNRNLDQSAGHAEVTLEAVLWKHRP